MVIVFEQDVRAHGAGRFRWRPRLFRARWRGRRTWKLAWGVWSLAYYPEPGVREFFAWVESGNTAWRDR
jgi:hypothetical protein